MTKPYLALSVQRGKFIKRNELLVSMEYLKTSDAKQNCFQEFPLTIIF